MIRHADVGRPATMSMTVWRLRERTLQTLRGRRDERGDDDGAQDDEGRRDDKVAIAMDGACGPGLRAKGLAGVRHALLHDASLRQRACRLGEAVDRSEDEVPWCGPAKVADSVLDRQRGQ